MIPIGVGVLFLLASGLVGLAAPALGSRRRSAEGLVVGSAMLGCGLLGAAALRVLTGGPAESWYLATAIPGGAWEMGVDRLSAWFLLILAFVGGAATLFGASYLRSTEGHGSIPALNASWSALLAAMTGVLIARSAVLFLVTWEIMALSAYLLIMHEHDRREVRQAGFVYLVATHAGTVALIVMFLAWGRQVGSFAFASFGPSAAVPPLAAAAILLLALVGFGMKAGLFPFHFWLAGAHAAAPSHVSAVLSAVMLKMGAYGLLRVLSLIGRVPAWWAWTVVALGLASAVLGVIWAIGERDLKRVLAYSSVENIGILVLGLGLGALGSAYGHPALALLGYGAALLHALNHALFKGLLFLGAGGIVAAAGTREIDRLGGVARRRPWTSAAFLVGALAIVGLPPLNGFVSEWMLVVGFLHAGQVAGPLRFGVLGAAGLALVGALALACFTRVVGVVLLGRPRDSESRPAGGEAFGIVLPMTILAATCALVGVLPGVARDAALATAAPTAMSTSGVVAVAGDRGPAQAVGLFAATLTLLVLLAAALRRAFAGRAPRRAGATWGCAYHDSTTTMQYTAASFGAPLLHAFQPSRRGEGGVGAEGDVGRDGALAALARRIWARVKAAAGNLRALQQGRLTTYLRYMIWTVLLLLVFLFAASSGAIP